MVENKLQRIAGHLKLIRQPDQSATKAAFEQYDSHFRQLVDLCEDYWYILRLESPMFCSLASKMFGPSLDFTEPI